MKKTPTKQFSKKIGVTDRHARRLKAKKDPRALAFEEQRKAKLDEAAAEILKMRHAAGTDRGFSDKVGASETVKRLREYERDLAKELEAARKLGDTDKEWIAQRNWLVVSEQLRKSENDAPKADALNKNQIPVAEVETEWTRAILVFRKTLESTANRVCANPLIAKTDKTKLKELIHDEHSRALKALENVDWEDDGDAGKKR